MVLNDQDWRLDPACNIPRLLRCGSSYDFHSHDDDLPLDIRPGLFVVRGLRVRNYSWAKYRCVQGSRGNHGYPVPASALHALGQVSALVPLVLSDYAGTNDADWRRPKIKTRSSIKFARCGLIAKRISPRMSIWVSLVRLNSRESSQLCVKKERIMLKVLTRNLGNVAVLCLQGRIVIGETESLRSAVLAQTDASVVVLDLAQVNIIDASGLGALLKLREQTQAKGIEFRLRNVTSLVGRVLEITQLNTVFAVSYGTAALPDAMLKPPISELAACA